MTNKLPDFMTREEMAKAIKNGMTDEQVIEAINRNNELMNWADDLGYDPEEIF